MRKTERKIEPLFQENKLLHYFAGAQLSRTQMILSFIRVFFLKIFHYATLYGDFTVKSMVDHRWLMFELLWRFFKTCFSFEL